METLKVKNSEGKEIVLVRCKCGFYRLENETCSASGCSENPATTKKRKRKKEPKP